MNCRKCKAELEEGTLLCPVCGEDNAQEELVPVDLPEEDIPAQMIEMENDHEEAAEALPEAEEESPADALQKPRKAGWKVAAAVISCVVLLGVLAAAIFYGINGGFKLKENDIFYKESYTMDAEKAIAAADKVVATYGDYELTNGQLQVYYWTQVTDFLNEYYYYASSMGLDYTQPLDTQVYSQEDGMTWQQYFLENALSAWTRYQMLCHMANEAGYEMPADLQAFFDALPEDMAEMATTYGYESADAMIRELYFGSGSRYQDYEDFLHTYYFGFLYFSDEYDKLNPTDEEIERHFAENSINFEYSGITQDSGDQVDVRHILISVEGGTTDESGNVTYSEAEWDACRAEAQGILDEWLSGDKNEESFAELANTYSEDPGSNTTGGLYQGVVLGDMVEEFEAWCFDESRQPGNYGLVKTPFGYHIMYFVKSEPIWFVQARSSLITETMNARIEEATADMTLEVDYKKIVLGELDLG